jgi:hypothetical protein
MLPPEELLHSAFVDGKSPASLNHDTLPPSNPNTPDLDEYTLRTTAGMPEIMEPANGVPTEEINNLKITPSITMTAPDDSPSEPEAGMFTDELISHTIAATLPPTYVLRPLRKSDYAIGFLDVLRVLTTVGDITEEEWNGRYDWMNNQGKGGYYIMVIEDQGKIVGTGALLVERKLYVLQRPLR